jgi:hypothetical protein
MNGNDINATEVLTQLKSGTILFKQKNDGKKRSRRFFLHEHESFISYDKSRRLFGRPHQCKYRKMFSNYNDYLN